MTGFVSELTLQEIAYRIILAIIIGGMIGYERGTNNRPAGFRTHILVCLGATTISLLQDRLRINLINYAMENGAVASVVKTDLGRLGAQVISGIGFLGAGTIIREKGGIAGLTTAASIWVTGCIGLGIGWGFYTLSIISGVAVLITLVTFKKIEVVLIDRKVTKSFTITFNSDSNLELSLRDLYEVFKNHRVKLKKMKKNSSESKVFLTVIIPKNFNHMEMISELTMLESVSAIRDI